MLKVLVADDHAVVRQGLKQILSETPDMIVGAEAASGDEVLALLERNGWDVIVLDISMPGRSGLDILGDLGRLHPEIPVLVLSMHPEDQVAIHVLRAGASGYMTKETAPDELVNAIRKVFSGGKYVSPQLAEQLASQIGVGSRAPLHESLSGREYQVFRLIVSGETLTEIAEQLSLSVKTVSTYRRRVLDKMQMESNAQLTRYAIENRLVD